MLFLVLFFFLSPKKYKAIFDVVKMLRCIRLGAGYVSYLFSPGVELESKGSGNTSLADSTVARTGDPCRVSSA